MKIMEESKSDQINGKTEQELIANYKINAHGLLADISISKSSKFVPDYTISYIGISNASRLLLSSLRTEITHMVPIDPSKIQDSEYTTIITNKYTEASSILIDKYLPGTNTNVKKLLIAYIINTVIGLGELEIPLADENLEEITVNGSDDFIWVYHNVIGWCRTNIKIESEDLIYSRAEQIGRAVGREINMLSPLMDAELADGSRVNATLYPVSQSGNTITIRKFGKNPWTMVSMIKNKTISSDLAALVWLLVENEISFLISGGTASGKTSFLNAMSIFFPPSKRIISIEETRELTLPNFLQWVPMLSRSPNPEGKGEVTLYNLMINALRQRPDIMVIGEIRTKKDAETLFEAIHTGHSVYGTVHADNVQDTIIRISNPPIDIPKILINAIGGIVSVFRHRKLGIRRVLEIGEILKSGDASVLYRWNIRDDSFYQINEMSRLLETLGVYSGLTRKEISDDIAQKSKILNWMSDNNIVDVNDSGFIVSQYYLNKSKIFDIINQNLKYSKDLFE